MKRVLLDTNIYGEMAVDKDLFKLRQAYKIKRIAVVYGFPLIRKELKATPRTKSYHGGNLRIAMLSLYDEFIAYHKLRVDEEKLHSIALKYYEMYMKLGGNKSKDVLLKDFIIVACASQNNMDIVVSNDDASMLSELSLKAYQLVNKILELTNPNFIGYEEFKTMLLR